MDYGGFRNLVSSFVLSSWMHLGLLKAHAFQGSTYLFFNSKHSMNGALVLFVFVFVFMMLTSLMKAIKKAH